MTYRLPISFLVLIFIGCTTKPTESKLNAVDTVRLVQQDTSVVYALRQLYVGLKEEGVAEGNISLKKDQSNSGIRLLA